MTKRRDFIKQSMLGTAGIAIGGVGFSAKSYAAVIGSNERLNIAVIGIRSRGVEHIQSWCAINKTHNVNLITLCDADESFFAERAKTVNEKTGVNPSMEWDMRKVFENRDIHAVSFATPNHWHALGSIWACQAGKHVYVEKPCSHNIFEGRKMIEASRKYNVRLQVGFQNRSVQNIIEAMKFLHDGGIGEVYMARGTCFKPRDSFGIAEDSEPPASLHYDLWLGPAPWRRYNEKRSHYNWHWFWDTGNGDTGNQGPHQFDFARWGLNKNEHPVSVYAAGGVYGIDPRECAQETPNTLSCTFKYSDGKMLEFETRGRYTNNETDVDISIGNIFYGTEGYLELKGESGRPWKAFRKREKEPFAMSKDEADSKHQETISGSNGVGHFANFVNAIRSGKNEDLNCDITEGHYSCVLPHLANISHRLGRGLKFEGDTEKFINDPEADALLTQKYRDPYVVPEKA
jgi:predicted dehydrogenase